ncbi:hypothetical protein Gogos_010102, partial [Gossypium gossypioides]|nr:hypothetical protein [Gossypium gossypioides]
MDSKMHLQPWWLRPISLLLQLSNLKNWANAAPQVPCYFIFGDSLSDSGNNNNLKTLAKVNYRPYGIDFPKGPTGRFSNGRNVQDAIVELLGFEEYMPPFAKSEKENILQGVNYASGASGILDETGSLMDLYKTGARIFALFGLGQLGCTPNAIATHGTNGSLCVTKLNDAAFLFNQRLIPLVMALNSKLTDAKFTYLNYSPTKVAKLSL